MKIGKMEKTVIAVTAIFIVVSLLFVFGGNILNDLGSKKRKNISEMPEADSSTEVIKGNIVVEQTFVSDLSSISEIGIVFVHEYGAAGTEIAIELLNKGNVVAADTYQVSGIKDQHRTFLNVAPAVTNCLNKEFTLRVYSTDGDDTGLKILVSKTNDSTFKYNNRTIGGTLCFSASE